MQNENIIKRNELLARKVIANLKKRHFNAFYCETKGDALKQAVDLISENETIAWGGSVTLDEIGIKDYLENNGYKVINRDKAKTPEEKRETLLKGLMSDCFLMSTNALSEDGELVNIDGMGTRISALCYGPKKIIVITGMNKITKSLEDAISRARNYAAPVNNQRIAGIFDTNNPCVTSGSCVNCTSPTSICSQILVTRLCNPEGRINVILVNEELGY